MENASEQAGGGSVKPGQQRIMILIGSMDVGGTETHLNTGTALTLNSSGQTS